MTNLEILTIGDELLEGSRTNTNASWLAETLSNEGVKIKRIITVGDDPSLISDVIRESIERGTNLLIVTGGLGPTPDDRTLEALSKALGEKRRLNEDVVTMIKERYSRLAEKDIVRKGGITPARKKMARIPENAIPIPNPIGGAPGVLAEKDGTKILCLPGVPEEMKSILKRNIKKLDIRETKDEKKHLTLKVRGIEESSLTPLYDKVKEKFSEVEIRSYPTGRGAKGKIIVKFSSKKNKTLLEVEEFFRKLIENLNEVKIE